MKERRKPPAPEPLPAGFAEVAGKRERRNSGPVRDPATGLYTMTALQEFIRYEIDGGSQTERNERFVTPVCAVAISLDALAGAGEAERARLLDVVIEAMSRITRRADRMARENDVFIALLRRTLAKRAREHYAPNMARLVGEAAREAGCPTTLSFGIASLTEHLVRNPEDMLKKAFAALAAARREGPGSIVIYDLRSVGHQPPANQDPGGL